MTLKGKKKALRNIIASLIAIIFIGGVTSIVHSIGNASIKIQYVQDSNNETWDTIDKFEQKWFTNLETGSIEFIVDLKEYYDVVSKQKEILVEAPFNISATANATVINEIRIEEIKEGSESKFNGKYKVTIKLPEEEADYSLDINLTVEEENVWDIPAIEKNFSIVRDTVLPVVDIKDINNNERYNEKNVLITTHELNLSTTDLMVDIYSLNDGTKTSNKYTGEENVTINFNKDNEYKIVAYAKDKAGNTSETNEVTFFINVEIPSVSINEDEVKDFYNKDILNIEIKDGNGIDFNKSTYTIIKQRAIVETGSFEELNKLTGSKKIQFLENGQYKLKINAVDTLGKEATINREIIIDTEKPVIALSGIDKEYITEEDNRELTISIEEGDINNSTNTITVTKDGEVYREGLWNLGIEEIVGTLKYTFEEEGEYSVNVTSVDRAGNEAEEKRLNFTVDLDTPNISIKNNNEEVNNNKFFGISDSKEIQVVVTESNLKSASITVTHNGEPYSKELSFKKSKKQASLKHTFAEDGIYVMTITAVDEVNKEDSKTITFTIDNINPVLNIEGVTNNQFFGKNEAGNEIKVILEDINISNENTIAIKKNGEEYKNGDNAFEFIIKEGNAEFTHNFTEDGSYELVVHGKDKANNNVSDTISFTVDNISPVVSFEGITKEYLGIADKKELKVSIDDINISDKNTITINKDGQEYKNGDKPFEFTVEEGRAVFAHNFIEDGVYDVVVNSEDKAGNIVESDNTITFTVDNIKPEIIISEEIEEKITAIVEGKNYNKDLNLVIETKDVNQDENTIEIIEKQFNGVNKSFELTAFGDKTEIDGLEVVTLKDTLNDEKFKTEIVDGVEVGSNGKYTLQVKSVDRASNESTKTITFTIDKIAPKITIGEVEKFNQNGPDVNVTVREENADNEEAIDNEACEVIVSYTKVAQGEGEDETDVKLEEFKIAGTNSTKDYLGNNFELNGKYTIKVTATDAAGNVAEAKTYTFTKDSAKPTIEVTGLDAGTEYDDKHYNKDVTLEVKTTDFNQDVNKLIIKGTFEGKSILKDEKGNAVDQLVIENFTDNGVVTEKGNEKVLTYEFKEEANYEVEIISTDKAGNVETTNKGTEGASNNIKFTVDKTAPVLEILELDKLNGTFNQNGEKVSIKVIEENYNTNDVKVSYTKQTPTKDGYNEPQPIKLEPNVITDNKEFIKEYSGENFKDAAIYVGTVTATDKAGNIAETKTVKFTTDTVAPEFKVFYEEGSEYIEKTDAQLNEQGVHEYKSKKIKVTSYDVNQEINTVTITRDGVSYEVDGFTTEGRTRTFEHNFTQEGDYVVTVNSTDLSKRTSTKTFKFTIDTTAPVITINDFNKLNNSFNNPGKAVTVNVKEHNFVYNTVNVTINKELEDGSIIVISTREDIEANELITFANTGELTSHTYNNFGDDAKYTMTITAKDLAGNIAVKENLALTATTDTTKPVATIDGVDNTEHYNTDKTITVSIIDVNHDINTVTVTKDGKAYFTSDRFNISGTTNVKTATLSQSFSEEGEYVVTVYSKDKAGNELSSPVTKTFTIDKTKPVITPLFSGENRTIKNGEYINKIFTPNFKLDEAEDKVDSVTLNNASVAPGAVPMSSSEMVYNYTVQASDKAGNKESLNITYTVDVTNPEVKITGILDGFFSEDMKPEYKITDTNLDAAKTSALLNGKAFESGTAIKEQDYYNLKLLGTDLASNATARNIVFAIDKDKPVIKFLEAMSGEYFTEDFIPNFIIEDLTDYTIISMTLDGEDYELGDMITTEGKHVLYIEVKDKAENIESISVEFILDKTKPKFIVSGIKDKDVYFEALNAEISLENPLDKITGVTVNGELAQGDTKEVNGQQVITLQFNENNKYEVVLNAVDDAGNKTEEVINFEITDKNIFTAIYKNKKIFYPLIIAMAAIAVVLVVASVKKEKNNKENSEEESEE